MPVPPLVLLMGCYVQLATQKQYNDGRKRVQPRNYFEGS